MSYELKPCPFCGSKNVEIYPLCEEEKEDGYFVYCNDCQMETGVYSDEEHVAQLWNRRVNN